MPINPARECTTIDGLYSPLRKNIRDSDELDAALGERKDEQVAIIQFKAVWCKKCESVSKELEDKLGDDVLWLSVDIDAAPELAARFNVNAMPRFDVYAHGRMQNSMEAFDVSSENVLKAVSAFATAERPLLQLDNDF